MITQIIPKGFIAAGFIPFAQEEFGERLSFIVTGDGNDLEQVEDASVYESENIVCIKSPKELLFDKRCRRLIRDSEAIILNWFDACCLALLCPFLDKVAILFWGGDLQALKKGLEAGRLRTKALGTMVERVPHLATLLPGDYRELCSVMNPRGEWHLCRMWAKGNDGVSGRIRRADDGVVRILLGNSATQTNRHFEAIDSLARFQCEKIEVYAPLSYGDLQYRDSVVEYGRNRLGAQFVPILEPMPRDEYQRFLKAIPIGVFNHNRQQGMGNIHLLLAQGSKVYLSKDSPMLADFISKGFDIFCTEDISSLDFEEFIAFSDDSVAKNTKLGSYKHLRQEAVQLWSNFLDSLGG